MKKDGVRGEENIGEGFKGAGMSRPKPDTQICDHDRHANIKPKPDINKNQLNF